MTREEFMIKARTTARQILDGKENGIMNLVQQAYAEGKRHAEVETLREAIEEALNKRDSVEEETIGEKIYPIDEDIAKGMGIKPKIIKE